MKKITLYLFVLAACFYIERPLTAQSCDYPWQRDSAGNKCGERSAQSREGGRIPPAAIPITVGGVVLTLVLKQ